MGHQGHLSQLLVTSCYHLLSYAVSISVLLSIHKSIAKESIFEMVFCVLYAHWFLNTTNFLARCALNCRLERMSLLDHAVVLVLGALNDERCCL